MSGNASKMSKLRENAKTRALAVRDRNRVEREQRAASFRTSLLAQIRSSRGAAESLDAATEALLDSAVSAHIEIARTSKQFIEGRASAKAMHRLGLARSELRRALRALGLIADSGEPDAAPPSGPTLADIQKEYDARERSEVAS